MTKPSKEQTSLYTESFPCKNWYSDRLAYYLTTEELAVFFKILRDILGWEEKRQTLTAHIALSIFVNSCGLSRDAVIKTLDTLVKFKIVVRVGPAHDPKKGQAYKLQIEADSIDWAGLEQRKAQQKAKNIQRTQKARTYKLTGLSHNTGIVQQTATHLVQQTATHLVQQTQQINKQKETKEEEEEEFIKIEEYLTTIKNGNSIIFKSKVKQMAAIFSQAGLTLEQVKEKMAAHLDKAPLGQVIYRVCEGMIDPPTSEEVQESEFAAYQEIAIKRVETVKTQEQADPHDIFQEFERNILPMLEQLKGVHWGRPMRKIEDTVTIYLNSGDIARMQYPNTRNLVKNTFSRYFNQPLEVEFVTSL